MATLAEKLLVPAARPRLVQDSVRLVDEEVASKAGLSGIAIKAAYAVVKTVKAGIIPDVLDAMLDDFVARLEPFYADFEKASGTGFAAFLAARSDQVAEALLAITDERARISRNATLKKAYEKLRPTGKKHVESAVPRLGRLVEPYLR